MSPVFFFPPSVLRKLSLTAYRAQDIAPQNNCMRGLGQDPSAVFQERTFRSKRSSKMGRRRETGPSTKTGIPGAFTPNLVQEQQLPPKTTAVTAEAERKHTLDFQPSTRTERVCPGALTQHLKGCLAAGADRANSTSTSACSGILALRISPVPYVGFPA